jgi:hypothetical protein
MIGNRRCAFALATVFTIICSIAPANAAQFDGNWSMVAVTTSGHCGQIPIGLGIGANGHHGCSLDLVAVGLRGFSANVRLGSLADITARSGYVSFTPKSGHSSAH